MLATSSSHQLNVARYELRYCLTLREKLTLECFDRSTRRCLRCGREQRWDGWPSCFSDGHVCRCDRPLCLGDENFAKDNSGTQGYQGHDDDGDCARLSTRSSLDVSENENACAKRLLSTDFVRERILGFRVKRL